MFTYCKRHARPEQTNKYCVVEIVPLALRLNVSMLRHARPEQTRIRAVANVLSLFLPGHSLLAGKYTPSLVGFRWTDALKLQFCPETLCSEMISMLKVRFPVPFCSMVEFNTEFSRNAPASSFFYHDLVAWPPLRRGYPQAKNLKKSYK